MTTLHIYRFVDGVIVYFENNRRSHIAARAGECIVFNDNFWNRIDKMVMKEMKIKYTTWLELIKRAKKHDF